MRRYIIWIQVKFKTAVLEGKERFCDNSDTKVFVKITLISTRARSNAAAADRTYKKAVFNKCEPFTKSVTEKKHHRKW